MPEYYPLFLNVKGRACVVVGGGEVAERKAKALVDHKAEVWVVSPRVTEELRRLVAEGSVRVELRDYQDGDLEGAVLVIAATDKPDLNARVSAEAQTLGILVNVVDDPERSTFIVPSLFNRGDVSIAISTGGRSPALAKKIRLILEESLPEELASLAELLSEIRHELKSHGVTVEASAWQASLDADVLLNMLGKGDRQTAKDRILSSLLPAKYHSSEE